MRSALLAGVILCGAAAANAQPVSAACTPIVARGTLTEIVFPGATQTLAAGINAKGVVVGTYVDAAGATNGFLWARGQFSTVRIPGSNATWVADITAAGAIVGSYLDASGYHGFILDHGELVTLDVPGAVATSPKGMNNAGTVIGTFLAPGGEDGIERGFIFERGQYSIVDYPAAASTNLDDITESGVILGGAFVGTGFVDFLYRDGVFETVASCRPEADGILGVTNQGHLLGHTAIGPGTTIGMTFTRQQLETIAYPGAYATYVVDANGAGTLIGHYYDAIGPHSYVFLPQRGSRVP